jgi:CRP-like cAMP-binding protein
MSVDDDIVFLERVPTLALLGRDALRILAISADSRSVSPGWVLFREGDLADCGYVVQDGSFELTGAGNGAAVTVGPATLLGELALITETTRPVTATASERASVLRIPRTLFLRMLDGFPDAAERLRAMLTARVEEAARDIGAVRQRLDTVTGR